jgi:hypothetical protein
VKGIASTSLGFWATGLLLVTHHCRASSHQV